MQRANKLFCSGEHREAFHHRNAARGQVAVPLLMISRRGKNGRTELTSYAFSELSALADKWNTEDRLAGRRPDIHVATKKAACWAASDLR